MSAQSLTTGHVGLNVTDLSRSIDFYTAIFGFDVIGHSHQQGREYAFLGSSGEIKLTLWQQSTGTFDGHAPGLHHLSFQVEDVAEVRRIADTVLARNAKVFHKGIVAHAENATSGGLFFEDPDGIRLEVFASEIAGAGPAPTPGAPTCGFF